jgi:NADH-quinone oxidoreductase subunit C
MLYATCVDVVGSDRPGKIFRFTVIYHLSSVKYSSRLSVVCHTNEVLPIFTLQSIFKSAVWSERELWDLFGVQILGCVDLRRILTDYGFRGHPLRKDFPLTGFLEIMYNDQSKTLNYEKVELTQEYRNFQFYNPWHVDE